MLQDHEKWREYQTSIDSAIRKHFKVPEDRVIADEDTLRLEPEWLIETRVVVKQFCEKMQQEQASLDLAIELEKEDVEEVV